MFTAQHLSAIEGDFNRSAMIEDRGQESLETLDMDQPEFYVHRSRCNLLSNRYIEALSDANMALEFEGLEHHDRLTAASMKIIALAKLGRHDDYLEDLEFLSRNFTIKVENTHDYVILTNVPDGKEIEESINNFFLRSGICKSKEDINRVSHDIYIVNKNLQKQLSYDFECPTNDYLFPQRGGDLLVNCLLWCDANAESAISWCVNYPTFCLVNACNVSILEIQRNCRACCLGGFNQDICAAPFGDILSVMQIYLRGTSCACY